VVHDSARGTNATLGMQREHQGRVAAHVPLHQPMRASCCARAANGHVAAAPPSSTMNSCRFMSDMGIPPLRLPVYHEPTSGFLEADLNRSESEAFAGPHRVRCSSITLA
jgi:hypothetical protein